MTTKPDNDTKKHYDGTTIVLPKVQFKDAVGVDSDNFAATTHEKEYYQSLIDERTIQGKYVFEGLVDKGGMGAIFKVRDQDLNRPVAMKIILPVRKDYFDSIEDFVKEAKITGFLEHPNIISVHEFGLLPETGIFFTMQLLEGETLRDILAAIKRGDAAYVAHYTPYRLLSIFRKVCDAVAYAHSMGVLHLDIKPTNIIVGQYGQVFLIDWGAAKVIGDPAQEKNSIKRAFWKTIRMERQSVSLSKGKVRVQGSFSFMSPEQARGRIEQLDARSDIFLLGSMLYTMFTLCLPYVDKTLRKILEKARTRTLIPPQQRSPERQIPEEVCRVIMKAMAVDKTDRYQGVEEFAQDIDLLISGRWLQQDTKKFRPGEILMREGEIGQEAYLILSGNVLVTKQMTGSRVVLRTCQEGDIIGEMSLISDEPRSATVEALENTTVAVLTKRILSEHLKKLPPYMEKIISALTMRLQQTDAMIHPHLISDCSGMVLKHLRLIFKDKSNEPQTIELPLQDVIEEIAQDLGLPRKKVKNVLFTAVYLNLVLKKQSFIRIPDMGALAKYTQSVAMQNVK